MAKEHIGAMRVSWGESYCSSVRNWADAVADKFVGDVLVAEMEVHVLTPTRYGGKKKQNAEEDLKAVEENAELNFDETKEEWNCLAVDGNARLSFDGRQSLINFQLLM